MYEIPRSYKDLLVEIDELNALFEAERRAHDATRKRAEFWSVTADGLKKEADQMREAICALRRFADGLLTEQDGLIEVV